MGTCERVLKEEQVLWCKNIMNMTRPLNNACFRMMDLCNPLCLLHSDSEEVRNSKVS